MYVFMLLWTRTKPGGSTVKIIVSVDVAAAIYSGARARATATRMKSVAHTRMRARRLAMTVAKDSINADAVSDVAAKPFFA